jgi:hypothetical protein
MTGLVRRRQVLLVALMGVLTEHQLTPLEIVLVASVMTATAVFEVWFFFFSGSPIGNG